MRQSTVIPYCKLDQWTRLLALLSFHKFLCACRVCVRGCASVPLDPCMDSQNHQHSQETELFSLHKETSSCCPASQLPHTSPLTTHAPASLSPGNIYSVPRLWILKCCIKGIIQYLTFGDWYFLLRVMSLRSIQVAVYISKRFVPFYCWWFWNFYQPYYIAQNRNKIWSVFLAFIPVGIPLHRLLAGSAKHRALAYVEAFS